MPSIEGAVKNDYGDVSSYLTGIKDIKNAVRILENSILDPREHLLDNRINELACEMQNLSFNSKMIEKIPIEASKRLKIFKKIKCLRERIEQLLRFFYIKENKRNSDKSCVDEFLKTIEETADNLESFHASRASKKALDNCIQKIKVNKTYLEVVAKAENKSTNSRIDAAYTRKIRCLEVEMEQLYEFYDVICSDALHCFLDDPDKHKEKMWIWVKDSLAKAKNPLSFFGCLNYFFTKRKISEDKEKDKEKALELFIQFKWNEILPNNEVLLVVTGLPIPIFFPLSFERLAEDHPLTEVCPSVYTAAFNLDNSLDTVSRYINVVKGKTVISEKNVFFVMCVAEYLKDKAVVDQCCDFLKGGDLFKKLKNLDKSGKLGEVFTASFDLIIDVLQRCEMYPEMNDLVKAILTLLLRFDTKWLETIISERISFESLKELLGGRQMLMKSKGFVIDVAPVFSWLARLKTLPHLNFGKEPVFYSEGTDNHLYFMKNWLAPFCELNLRFYPGVTDEGLKCLSSNKELRKVYFEGNAHVTLEGLLSLPDTLEEIHIKDCPGVTEDEICLLMQARPKWKIVRTDALKSLELAKIESEWRS